MFNSPATNNQETAPASTTVSNAAFRAKVKTQIDAVKNELTKDVQQQVSDAMASGKQKYPSPETQIQENTDTTTMVTPPSTTEPANNTAGSSYYNNQAPTTYVAPANNSQTPAPANNNRSNNGQGSWQIQY